MRIPPPRTSAWRDHPPTPENVQRKQVQLDQPTNESGPSKPPQRKHQLAALPPPREKSTRKKTVPEQYTESDIYGKKHPVEVEKDILCQRIGKKLLARSPVVLADRTFPGESLSPTRFPIIAVTRKEETTTSRMTLRMRPARCLGLPLPPRKRRLSSPDSPGKGESVSCCSLFPKLFQSVRRRNQSSGPIKT